MTLSPKFTVVVHEPKEVEGKLVKANAISQALNGNSFYPTPSPTLVAFNKDIGEATKAQAGTKTMPPTVTVAARDTAVRTMDADIESYRLACQTLVNDPANENIAEQIAESFDMEMKTHAGNHPRQDEILDGPEPASALYRMKGAGPHQVQMMTDPPGTPGKGVINLDGTRTGKAIIRGLTLRVEIWLRNRQILTHDAYGDWSDWKSFTPRK